MNTEVLELQGVTKVFRVGPSTVVAVDDVDLAVHAGEFVCVYGASGAGKSTLAQLALIRNKITNILIKKALSYQ